MASANVKSVLNTLKQNPELVKDLNKALTMIFATANIDLTADEKKEFIIEIANTIASADKGVHVHL